MKRVGDEEKIMGPLFPRLHVNDTEKGGLREPPRRRKMTLYEQLNISSQGLNSSLAPTLSLLPDNACTSVPSISLSQGGGHERSVFSPFYVPPPTPTHSSEKLHPCFDGVNLSGAMAEFDRKSTTNTNNRPSNVTMGLLSTNDRNSCCSHALSNSRKQKPGDEDDLRAPAFVHSRVSLCSDKDLPNTSRERFSPFISTYPGHSTVATDNSPLKTAAATCSSPMQPQNACDKNQKPTRTTDMRSKHVRNHFEENLKETVTSIHRAENSASVSSMGENIVEPLNNDKTSENQELQNSQVDDSRRLCDADEETHQKIGSTLFPEKYGNTDAHLVESIEVEKENISRERNEPCSEASPGNSHRNPERDENGGKYHEEMVHESLQVGDVDRNSDASKCSMVDSVLGMDISPNDVVGVIGIKHFWNARRTIVNQQKVFAAQVFELHRLIKVQRLIAGSPHLVAFHSNMEQPRKYL
ncbi:PREDICTED: ELF3-like protein 2 [Nelumbo nucifera]|uniref:ELF3-like protein 2 n=1 Tax=Nelumbo nucifera TaxID=4432 RepID=A0A1U8AHF3_NELNU|nr:PREDICTED: ELF3-like protein 2 [Nelumbo nucifera]